MTNERDKRDDATDAEPTPEAEQLDIEEAVHRSPKRQAVDAVPAGDLEQEPAGASGPDAAPATADELVKGSSLWRDAWQRLLKNKAAMAGGIIVAVMMLCCLAAPLFAAYVTHFTFDEQHRVGGARPPGSRSVPITHVTWFDAEDYGFADADFDTDGQVTPAELSRLLARVEFERFDDDDNGLLESDEIDGAPITRIQVPGEEDDLLITMQAASTTFLLRAYDQFDRNRDHLLEAEEFSAASQQLAAGELTGRTNEFVTHIEREGLVPLERNDVRDIAREMSAGWCPSLDNCTIDPEQSLLFTDIFPETQAWSFVEVYDGDGSGALSQAEFPGVPEPHTHYLGTDEQGRDLLTRILYGGQISFMVGLLATFVSLIIGVSWGAIAGYAGGRVDNMMMRIVDVMYGLPFMFLVILLMVIVGQKIYLLFIALGAVQWLTMSRIVRGQVISLKTQEFVEAARSIGVSPPAIVFKHLIPNALGPIIVYATLLVPAVMLEEAFLSFLGLGVKAPEASWGTLASDGANAIQTHPWLIMYPGLALALTLLSLNFLGDGLRDALDPHMRKD